ncbi:hypothetical protein [Fictibacillus phosphorivorans]|uniref:hypothetical protein n=1 Tax=Fictibacillus phosphorivorans TaxID=1221500 RepID=UPI0035EC9045
MTLDEIKKMRRQQFILMNVLLIILITLYLTLIRVIGVTSSQFFITLGVVLLIQSSIGFIRINSTKSLFSIYEKVSLYEKQKMGAEWKKQRKMSYIWMLITSGFLFMQAYWNRGITGDFFQIDIRYMLLMLIFILLLSNLSLFIHVKKVDSSISARDLKGYTRKTNLTAALLGAVSAIIFIFITLFYIMI